MSIGKSKAKVYMEKSTGVTFQDVAGIDAAKAELQEVVHCKGFSLRPYSRKSLI